MARRKGLLERLDPMKQIVLLALCGLTACDRPSNSSVVRDAACEAV